MYEGVIAAWSTPTKYGIPSNTNAVKTLRVKFLTALVEPTKLLVQVELIQPIIWLTILYNTNER